MRRGEIIWQTSTWRIPAERMKMRRPHDVPLSKQALAVLRGVREASEGNGYVFPSIRSVLKPLSENAMNSALRRMGYAKEEVCAHGFRTSASTILNERHHNPEVIEVALAHQSVTGLVAGVVPYRTATSAIGEERKTYARSEPCRF